MKYSLGLDIGTTSVGWAVINEDIKRIEDLGVRIFDTPENPKNGESLAKPRRDKRSMRRRLSRRRQRLNYLKNYFIENGLLSTEQVKDILDPAKNPKINPYEVRQKGANGRLSNEELFAAIYNIAKRRGYKSNRKKIEESDKESGKILQAISRNREYLEKYQTVGSALYSDANFSAHKRNKADSYSNSFIREDFENEARLILEKQGWTEKQIEALFHDPNKRWGGIFDQRPFMTEELITKMRGNCPLELGKQRAWKASWTFELFRVAQDLSHLEYNHGNKLTPEQIQTVINAAKQTQKITYKKVREVIGHKNTEDFRFDYIRGKREKSYEEEEKHEFCNLKYYHDIRKATGDDFAKIEQNTELFDKIGYILTANKDDVNIKKSLKELPISESSIDKLMALNYSGFAHLSIEALQKLTLHLLSGETYDKAVEAEYRDEFVSNKNELPPLAEEQSNQITNPVAKRAISQTRKIINAIIGKYGAPYQIKIECANELAKTFRDRKEIEKRQNENNAANNARIEKLKELGIINPTGQQIVKYKLYEEQLCKCQYCGKSFGPEIFLDDKLTEVDHIIPFSRCGNDGLANKALVCSACNQEKKNLAPFEKWGNDKAHWKTICDLAQGTNISFKKRDRILVQKLPKEEWKNHALNDTRYIVKFMRQYICKNLSFNKEYEAKQRVLSPTGFITSYLRKMYHLGRKDRELNNCHHAVDACIIATVSQGQIQKFAKWNQAKELGVHYSDSAEGLDEGDNPISVTSEEYEKMTADLLPWEDFDKEVKIRSGMSYNDSAIENLDDFRDKFRDFKTYDDEFLQKIHPLFVSRMPKRSTKGAVHEESIQSPKKNGDGYHIMKTPITKITTKNFNKLALEDDPILKKQISDALRANGGKIPPDIKLYKNGKNIDKNGRPILPVRSVRIYNDKKARVRLNSGTQFANNGGMACLDVYYDEQRGKYIFNPVYIYSIRAKNRKLPQKFITSLYPNDYVRLGFKDEVIEGYYVTYDIDGNRISLIGHNMSNKKDLIRKGLGATRSFEKINISILGDNYKPAKHPGKD